MDCDNEIHPRMSASYLADRDKAKAFVKQCKPLWSKAGEIFRNVFPRAYKKLTKFRIDKGLTRLAGPWMGMSINEGNEEKPVITGEHRDKNDATFAYSCILYWYLFSLLYSEI
jgi:hypothetical protein